MMSLGFRACSVSLEERNSAAETAGYYNLLLAWILKKGREGQYRDRMLSHRRY